MLVEAVVGEVHARLVEVVARRLAILDRANPREAVAKDVHAYRLEARDQHVDAACGT